MVGVVAPLDRLAVREISGTFLSQDERFEIADLRRAALSVREVARLLVHTPSTVLRELRRNASRVGYRPFGAHRRATLRRGREHPRRLDTNPELRGLVGELLGQRWSPQQISRHLHRRFDEDASMRLSHESVDQAVYRPGSTLIRSSSVALRHRSPLRTGRDHCRAQQRVERRRPRFSQPMLTIHERAFLLEDRAEAGHWEGDLILGKDQRSAIGRPASSGCCPCLRVTATISTTRSLPGWVTFLRGCCGRSPGARAPSWHATSTSPRR